MWPEGIRRLTLSGLNQEGLQQLIDHGEDLFVERKRQPPDSPKFGASAAAFANTLGGFLLLGVDDDKSVVGWQPPGDADVQSPAAKSAERAMADRIVSVARRGKRTSRYRARVISKT